MTPHDLAVRLGGDVTVDESFGQVTLDVPPQRWVEAAQLARDAGYAYFDWLSAYDASRPGDETDGGLAVVMHLWSVQQRRSVLLRTAVARDGGRLPTLTTVWPGADWHERETFEMFGLTFDGHPNLVPLLLPDGFEGNPLRKEFVLASRVAKAWPGEKEPGESDADVSGERAARTRSRRMLPPGVPAPDEWGPPR